MVTAPLVESAIIANTAASGVFILAHCLKRQGLLDNEAVIHLRHLLEQQIDGIEGETVGKDLLRRWRRQFPLQR